MGEFVSMSMDPSDDLTFWGMGEYLTTTGVHLPL